MHNRIRNASNKKSGLVILIILLWAITGCSNNPTMQSPPESEFTPTAALSPTQDATVTITATITKTPYPTINFSTRTLLNLILTNTPVPLGISAFQIFMTSIMEDDPFLWDDQTDYEDVVPAAN